MTKEAKKPKSEDALDQRRPYQRLSKKDRIAYAREKHLEDLMLPPKNPPPAWLSDPSLLPKKPPTRRSEE